MKNCNPPIIVLLTNDEHRELAALEYVMTWGFRTSPEDDERYRYLSNKSWRSKELIKEQKLKQKTT